jgi:hypothetical protein
LDFGLEYLVSLSRRERARVREKVIGRGRKNRFQQQKPYERESNNLFSNPKSKIQNPK